MWKSGRHGEVYLWSLRVDKLGWCDVEGGLLTEGKVEVGPGR